MMNTTLELSCRDPLVSRDGRPFGLGSRMRTLGWPVPSLVAGSLRTALGKAAGKEFSEETARTLLQVAVAGIFPVVEGMVYLPAPNDCVVEDVQGTSKQRVYQARPVHLQDGEGCDSPHVGLRPVLHEAEADFKPLSPPAWWPLNRYAAWLAGETVSFQHGRGFLQSPAIEERTHVCIDAVAGAAQDGLLFSTAALPLTHMPHHDAPAASAFSERFAAITLGARVRADGWCGEALAKLDAFHPLGGERRLVHWKATEMTDMWRCPQPLTARLAGAKQIRMVLATPGIFQDAGKKHAWKPGWLNEQLIGSPPDSDVTLRLVGVSIQRWKAVSGWSLAEPRGPKPVKRAVPAGGVYFFEVVQGNAAALAARWLEPMSDNPQDQRDGFGLAVWGIW